MKRGERILKAYQANPDAILEVVDADHMLFRITSESFPNIKYSVSLNTYFCDCSSQKSTCKHILEVQLIVKEYFSCPQVTKFHVEHMEHVDHLQDIVNLESMSSMEIDTLESNNHENTVERNDYMEGFLNVLGDIQKLVEEERSCVEHYCEKDMMRNTHMMRTFLDTFSKPITFERPSTIDISRRGSIASIQENVLRTMMGYRQKQKIIEYEVDNGSRPTPKRHAHVLVSHSKHKKTTFPNIMRAHCDKCNVNTRVEEGDGYVECKNCNNVVSLELRPSFE